MSETQTRPESRRAYLMLILIGAVIGIPAAFVAALFLALVHEIQDWLWTDLPDSLGHDGPPWYLVIGLPAVGGVIVWFARRFLPGDGGHRPLDGIGGGITPWQYASDIALAALATLTFGAVLGPEAPLIALGSAVGALVGKFVDLDRKALTVIATAGSFSAVSAVFGGPLVASLLLLEAGIAMGAQLIPALMPGLVAAAFGYILIIGFGDWGGLNEAGLQVPHLPDYDGTRLVDLALAIVVGIVTALLISQVRRLAVLIDRFTTGRVGLLPTLLVGARA